MHKMPCGGCDTGIYSPTPVMNGLAIFGECASRKEAIRAAPRCRHASHICYGALDWIQGTQFPMPEAEKQRIRDLCGELKS
jgi:hypothetical protein